MPLAAILSATAHASDHPELLRAQLQFATRPLIEYQARQAIQAGAGQIFIMVETVTPMLSRLVDHLGAPGVQVHLIRDMASLMRQLPQESEVLLFAEGMIVDQAFVAALAAQPGNALLVAPDDAATSHLERIDPRTRWAGLARIEPGLLFNTLDLIGDWDLVLTLFRAVAQNEPRRLEATPADIAEGRVALVDRQEAADLVGEALAVRPGGEENEAGAERYLLAPPARLLATRLLRMQIPVLHVRLMAAGMAVLAGGVLVPGLGLVAMLLFLLALTFDMAAGQVARAGRMDLSHDYTRFLAPGLVLLGFVWLGYRHGATSDGVDLALLAAVARGAQERGRVGRVPPWAVLTPGSAVLILSAGVLLGLVTTALAIAVLLGILSLAAMLLGPDAADGPAGPPPVRP